MQSEQSMGMDNEKKVSTKFHKCSSCGANLIFDPESQMLFCEHCGSKTQTKQPEQIKERDFLEGFSEDEEWNKEDAKVFYCKNCGAKVVLSKNETAKSCPFCGTPYVEQSEELEGIKPNGLIPFRISIKNAVQRVAKWVKSKLYAPKSFKKSVNQEALKGVYIPCFTFDSNTYSFYEGRLGKTVTRTVGTGKNVRTETYTKWFNVRGEYNGSFDDVLITAGKNFNQKNLDKVSPYNTNNGVMYNEEYLLGFMAYHYDYGITDCWSTAKSRIDAAIKRAILNKYDYTQVDYLNISTKHERVTYKYIMLPVYLGCFKYKKKNYTYYVNGETGKIYGKTPVSALKVLFTCLIGLAVVGLFLYLYLTGKI